MKTKVLITTVICMLLLLTFGFTAFATDEIYAETTAEEVVNEMTDVPTDETAPAEPKEIAEPEQDLNNSENLDLNDVSESETKEEATEETEELSQEESDAQSDEEGAYANNNGVQETESAPIFNSYLLKFSVSGNEGQSAEFDGGSEDGIAVTDILKALGYEISENSVIGYVEDSVDTDVINMKQTDNGLFITDNGHFEKASKQLVLTIDGEEVTINVEDDLSFYVASNGNDNNSGSYNAPLLTIQKALEKSGTAKARIILKTNIEENIVINKNKITLDLNGNVLKGNNTTHVIYVEEGELTIIDSNPAVAHKFKEQTSGDYSGLWIWDENATEHTVYGGVITGGKEQRGGGVFNNIGCTFSFCGGNIVGNSASSFGGGIFNSGNITISGGSISGNVWYECQK